MTIANKTVCSSLQLIRVESVELFYIIKFNNSVVIGYKDVCFEPPIIPGSLISSESDKDGQLSKSITFEISDVSPEIIETLQRMKYKKLVAMYKDEIGLQKICGTLDYPLSFDWSHGEGVYKITLRGEDKDPDHYVSQVLQ